MGLVYAPSPLPCLSPCTCARLARSLLRTWGLCADGTFSELAGIDPTDWRAAAADLPPVDSHSLVPVLMGTGESTRKEIPIGTEPRIMKLYGHEGQVSTIQGVIQEDESGKLWKLVIGTVGSESSNYLPQPFHHALADADRCRQQ